MIGLGRMEMGVDDSNTPEPAPFALPATVAERDFAQSRSLDADLHANEGNPSSNR